MVVVGSDGLFSLSHPERKDMAFGDISNAKEKLVNTNKKIKDRRSDSQKL